jgi:hypothetical protein
MRIRKNKMTHKLEKGAALAVLAMSLAGCVVEPFPPPPGAPEAAVYPGPYAYPEYPPYYYGGYGYYGPSVGVFYGGYRGGYRGWR